MTNVETYNIPGVIITLRDTEVILDRDLAAIYQVENRVLKQAVKRNMERFPNDFMFELTNDEINWLVSQSVIPSKSYLGGANEAKNRSTTPQQAISTNSGPYLYKST